MRSKDLSKLETEIGIGSTLDLMQLIRIGSGYSRTSTQVIKDNSEDLRIQA